MDRTDYRYNIEYRAIARAEMRDIAKRFLAGELGVIEASRALSPFWDMVSQEDLEPHIRAFVGINSDTDALPVGDVREYWASEALVGKDREISDAEAKWRDWGREAAEAIVQLLKMSESK
jgi:hypothetical protein